MREHVAVEYEGAFRDVAEVEDHLGDARLDQWIIRVVGVRQQFADRHERRINGNRLAAVVALLYVFHLVDVEGVRFQRGVDQVPHLDGALLDHDVRIRRHCRTRAKHRPERTLMEVRVRGVGNVVRGVQRDLAALGKLHIQ